MKKNIKVFCGLFLTAALGADAFATATPTPRAAVNVEHRAATTTSTSRATKSTTVSPRNNAPRTVSRSVAVRNVKTPNTNVKKATNRSAIGPFARAGNIISDAGNAIIRRAFGINRAAAPVAKTNARVATVNRNTAPKSSGTRARATAVFGDISKLGAGYNSCRETYNTCMDQFCAGANETYRRCYCSNTFRDFRDKEEALDAATNMLAQFENNNLTAVNLSAEEVNAMYSATAGEQAIKNDTSAAAAMLNDIGDLLSGKKKAKDTQKQTSFTSLSGLSLDFSADDNDDIFGMGAMSLFGDNSASNDLSTMEGVELYNNAHNQCMQLVASSCDAAAVRNMVKSAYSILITQDCNAYQKKIDAKTEKVKTTVRTAEKYLREARLEEYRAHNSADVNECLDKVETAMAQPTACGTNYSRCLDYSGVYINTTTGEPIYSPRLFKLNEILVLDGSSDVLGQNAEFNQFLDSKRMFAKSALDTCRDIADTVWEEYKRNALIRIAQAQDEKIEEVKMSCVSTMKECYDAQSEALKSFDDTTAQSSAALAARASKDMCVDKVVACAALYRKEGEVECKVDPKTNIIENADKCGLASLRNFVDNVDTTRVAEGCGTAVENYLKQLCTPTSGSEGYPWNCRMREFGELSWVGNENTPETTTTGATTLAGLVKNYALENCGVKNNNGYTLENRSQTEVSNIFNNLKAELNMQLQSKCAGLQGSWAVADSTLYKEAVKEIAAANSDTKLLTKFYSDVFGGNDNQNTTRSVGMCLENTVMTLCLSFNSDDENAEKMATYNAARNECILSDKWYEQRCAMLGEGYFENGVCYVAQ